jgi:hypothetical protein
LRIKINGNDISRVTNNENKSAILVEGRRKSFLYKLAICAVLSSFIQRTTDYVGKNIIRKIEAAIKDIANAITNSGLILIPGVSSSKNRSSPALDAGICPPGWFFFFLELIYI